MNLYLTLAVLEGRQQGRLPAWEGILLVKEPGETSDQLSLPF